MTFALLIIAVLILLGYQHGRGDANVRSDGNLRKGRRSHPLHPSTEERRESYAEERRVRLASITPESASWLQFYLDECESPAEAAFLRAVAFEYALLPDAGTLRGESLHLQLQVDVGAYRVDFLANNWLVIEIDGAEYHASADQRVRDAARDRYLESVGHTVLRIAAKVALRQPSRAMSDIRSALAVGRKEAPLPQDQTQLAQASRPGPTNVVSAFFRGVEAVGEMSKMVNEFANRAREVQRATEVNDNIFVEEKSAINTAMRVAESRISLERYIDQNPDRREDVEEIWMRLEAAVQDSKGNRSAEVCTPIPSISRPDDHKDAEIDEIIKRKHAALMSEREAYFEGIREQMRSADGRLSTLVREVLVDFGRHSTWVELTGHPGQFVRMQRPARPFVVNHEQHGSVAD